MVAPGNENEYRIDYPDAVFPQEYGNGSFMAHKLLHHVVERAEGADGAPETPHKHKIIGISGHHNTQVKAVPRLLWAIVGPNNSIYMISTKEKTVGHLKIPGYHLLLMNPPINRFLSRLHPGADAAACCFCEIFIPPPPGRDSKQTSFWSLQR